MNKVKNYFFFLITWKEKDTWIRNYLQKEKLLDGKKKSDVSKCYCHGEVFLEILAWKLRGFEREISAWVPGDWLAGSDDIRNALWVLPTWKCQAGVGATWPRKRSTDPRRILFIRILKILIVWCTINKYNIQIFKILIKKDPKRTCRTSNKHAEGSHNPLMTTKTI